MISQPSSHRGHQDLHLKAFHIQPMREECDKMSGVCFYYLKVAEPVSPPSSCFGFQSKLAAEPRTKNHCPISIDDSPWDWLSTGDCECSDKIENANEDEASEMAGPPESRDLVLTGSAEESSPFPASLPMRFRCDKQIAVGLSRGNSRVLDTVS